jgi:hypothetical protein
MHSPDSKENMLPIVSGSSRSRRPQVSPSSGHINNFSLAEEFPLYPSGTGNNGERAGATHKANASSSSASAPQVGSSSLIGDEYHVEPFVPATGEFGRQASGRRTAADSSVTSGSGSGLGSSSSRAPYDAQQSQSPLHSSPSSSSLHRHRQASPPGGALGPHTPGQQVYVVHHDAGRAPVTVFAAEGAEVVELPPGYFDQIRNRGGEGDAARSPQQQQQQQQQAVSPTRQNHGSGAHAGGVETAVGNTRRPLPSPGQVVVTPPSQRSARQPGEARKPPREP